MTKEISYRSDGTLSYIGQNQLVLTLDLQWVMAKNLIVGQKIIAFDEFPVDVGSCNKKRRKIRPASITNIISKKTKIIELTMEDGSKVESSDGHNWLIATKQSRNQKWATSAEIFIELFLGRKRYMHKFIDVWGENISYDCGWLSGIADGEGYITFLNKRGVQLGMCQRKGLVWENILRISKKLGFSIKENKTGDRDTFSAMICGGWTEILKFLGVVRPIRLLNKLQTSIFDKSFSKEMSGKLFPLMIVSAKEKGYKTVIGIETSTNTYFCDGFAARRNQFII